MRVNVLAVLGGLALAAVLVLGGATLTSAQEKDKAKDKGKEAAVTYVFEVYKDTAGEFRFRMKDSDDVLLCTSGKGYKTKDDCLNVVKAIQKEAAKARITDETKKDKDK